MSSSFGWLLFATAPRWDLKKVGHEAVHGSLFSFWRQWKGICELYGVAWELNVANMPRKKDKSGCPPHASVNSFLDM